MSYWGAKNFPHLNLLTDKTPWRCQYVVSMESAIYEKQKMIMIILLVTLCLHKARRKWEEFACRAHQQQWHSHNLSCDDDDLGGFAF